MVCTWLHCIAANLARNRLRDGGRRGRNRGTSLEAMQESATGRAQFVSSEENPGTAAQRRELEAALVVCLEGLPDSYRMAFILRTFDNLSYGEIAEAVGCPEGTVKSRLNQARRRLRDCLVQRGVV
jgi:RNA polymerase sigma-70 factor (ECF subfamily)